MYVINTHWCGSYNDDDFNNEEMCCACGGGTTGGYIEEEGNEEEDDSAQCVDTNVRADGTIINDNSHVSCP